MDCIVHGVAKSWTWVNDFHFHSLPLTVNQLLCLINSNFLNASPVFVCLSNPTTRDLFHTPIISHVIYYIYLPDYCLLSIFVHHQSLALLNRPCERGERRQTKAGERMNTCSVLHCTSIMGYIAWHVSKTYVWTLYLWINEWGVACITGKMYSAYHPVGYSHSDFWNENLYMSLSSWISDFLCGHKYEVYLMWNLRTSFTSVFTILSHDQYYTFNHLTFLPSLKTLFCFSPPCLYA